jgi:hypothetical protein
MLTKHSQTRSATRSLVPFRTSLCSFTMGPIAILLVMKLVINLDDLSGELFVVWNCYNRCRNVLTPLPMAHYRLARHKCPLVGYKAMLRVTDPDPYLHRP